MNAGNAVLRSVLLLLLSGALFLLLPAVSAAGPDESENRGIGITFGVPEKAPLQGARPRLELQGALDTIIALNSGFGGGVFRVASGELGLLWEGASGEAVNQGPPMVREASFEIASTSKAFTSAAMLLLVEEGSVGLDQQIGQLLPPAYTTGLLVIHGHDYTPEITVRQCLAHTAGLPDYWNDPPYVFPGVNAFLLDYLLDPSHFWSPEEILSYVPGLNPIFVPGTGWHYSDTGYVLAGLIIEAVTGKDLHTVYRERLFDPLGLDDTWLHWREAPPGTLDESHRYEGTWDMYTKRHQSADWAGGGLVSSTRDLEGFIRALADDTLFSDPNTKSEMTAWVATGTPGIQYGLGLFRVNLGFGKGEIWGHDGYGNSWMYYWPEKDVTFVGALNQTENDWWPLVMAAVFQVDP